MAKSEWQIIFDYRQAIRQADKLDDIANRVDKIAKDKMNNMMTALKSSWQSDNSAQFCSKMKQVQSDIISDGNQIRKIADAIRTTAEGIKNAELRALEIAKCREYR